MKKFVEEVQAFNANLAEQPISGSGLFAIFIWNVIYNLIDGQKYLNSSARAKTGVFLQIFEQ
jgi:hypothetical protein